MGRKAEKESLTYERHLHGLSKLEACGRHNREIAQLKKQSKLPSDKTHLLCGIAHELVQRGRPVLLITACMLVQRLLLAKRDLGLSQELKKLDKFEAVLIDYIGYVQQNQEQMEVLFTFLAERCERRSVMITTNLVFSKWDQIFKDPMTTAAAVDLLVHHAIILELNLKS